ncbi:hypothetical protein O0A02_00435 [Staphylococcus pseudintermedius]|nr:hypothetical protein [Staphylococcus pseudintermedius]MDK3686838.1 hypothetical protein [Staphylococcus pseudintermedius]MDK3846651.1 hypothetical protein [Staphylococcus pseudintermedius]
MKVVYTILYSEYQKDGYSNSFVDTVYFTNMDKAISYLKGKCYIFSQDDTYISYPNKTAEIIGLEEER